MLNSLELATDTLSHASKTSWSIHIRSFGTGTMVTREKHMSAGRSSKIGSQILESLSASVVLVQPIHGGLVFLTGPNMNIGMDCSWYSNPEDALRESQAWDRPNPSPRVVQ